MTSANDCRKTGQAGLDGDIDVLTDNEQRSAFQFKAHLHIDTDCIHHRSAAQSLLPGVNVSLPPEARFDATGCCADNTRCSRDTATDFGPR
jgi:hypothetical protein